MPKNKKNLKIYAYQRKKRNNSEKNCDKTNSNNSKIIDQKEKTNKSFLKLNSKNQMNQSIISKKSFKNDNSCCIIL